MNKSLLYHSKRITRVLNSKKSKLTNLDREILIIVREQLKNSNNKPKKQLKNRKGKSKIKKWILKMLEVIGLHQLIEQIKDRF